MDPCFLIRSNEAENKNAPFAHFLFFSFPFTKFHSLFNSLFPFTFGKSWHLFLCTRTYLKTVSKKFPLLFSSLLGKSQSILSLFSFVIISRLVYFHDLGYILVNFTAIFSWKGFTFFAPLFILVDWGVDCFSNLFFLLLYLASCFFSIWAVILQVLHG